MKGAWGEMSDWQALNDEVVRHLQELLRCETPNPPGNETIACNYLRDVLAAEGIESEIFEAVPGRGNLAARLKAANPTKPPLLLTGHVDVVTVERDRWTRDPFGGDFVDGYVWGRGALDMKSKVAIELTVFLELKRRNLPLDRDILFVAFADEEAGGKVGAEWMWANHRDVVDAEYGFNEGGGQLLEINGKRFYMIQSGEKGGARVRIIARGKPGHASRPIDGSAMGKIGRALAKLDTWEPEVKLTAPVRAMLEIVATAFDGVERAQFDDVLADPSWEKIKALPLPPNTIQMLRAITRNTAVPTIIHAGQRINVIPSEVVLDVDCRILPGEDPDAWRDTVQAVVGDEVEVELLSRNSGIDFDPYSPLFDVIQETIDELDPGAKVVPFLTAGGTDARHMREIKIYGFFPMSSPERTALYSTLPHGHDERIAAEDLHFGTKFLFDVVTKFCTAN